MQFTLYMLWRSHKKSKTVESALYALYDKRRVNFKLYVSEGQQEHSHRKIHLFKINTNTEKYTYSKFNAV